MMAVTEKIKLDKSNLFRILKKDASTASDEDFEVGLF